MEVTFGDQTCVANDDLQVEIMGPQGPKEKDILVESNLFDCMNFGMSRVLLVQTWNSFVYDVYAKS